MEVSFEFLAEFLVVAVSGRLDTGSASAFDAEMSSVLTSPRPRILLDFAHTTYISSAGLRSVLQLVKHAAAHGGRVGICSAPPHIMEVVEMSGFPSLLDLYADRAGAAAGTTL